MRILMMTDDGHSIDRRILLEAETLLDHGHEVILLARHTDGKPVGEHIGRLKVEYLAPGRRRAPGPSMLDFGRGLVRPTIAALARDRRWKRLGRFLRHLARWLFVIVRDPHAHFRRELGRAGDGWIPLHRRLIILVRLAVAAGVCAVAAVLRGLLILARRLRNRRSGLVGPDLPSAWEKALIERAIYYDPDCVHAHDLPQLRAGVYASERLKVPLVYDAHELYPEIGSLTPVERTLLRSRENRFIRSADALITVNPFIAELMQKRYRTKPVTVITNATARVAGLETGSRPRLFHQALRLSGSVRILCYQGWFAKQGRGLIELVAAMGAVRKDVHLVMLGYGDAAFFETLAREAGAGDRVHILPAVPWDELLLWSASADVGIIPYQPVDLNHENCSPNKLFEFIAARLPILANDLKYLKLVVEGEGFGLVRRLDTPKDMAAAINEMFDAQAQHIQRARRAMDERGAAWEWPVEAEKLLQLYDEIIDRAPDPVGFRRRAFDRIPLPERTDGEMAA